MKSRIFAVLLVAAAAVPAFAGGAATPRLNTRAFPVPMPQYLAEIITEAAAAHNVDPNLVAAMAYRESRFETYAVSRRGAQGIMQLMPRTARALGVKDSFDPKQNVFGAAKYLKEQLTRFGGDVDLALAAYNAGPELVARKGVTATQEAIDYVAAIKSLYRFAARG